MSESQNIMPDDLVTVIYVPGAFYNYVAKPGSFGTAVRRTPAASAGLDSKDKYWDVFFPGAGIVCINERVLRKIDGESRNVGRWDYCVFNAPKYAKERRREIIEQVRG